MKKTNLKKQVQVFLYNINTDDLIGLESQIYEFVHGEKSSINIW